MCFGGNILSYLFYIYLFRQFTISNKLKFGSGIEPRRVSFPNEAKVVIVGGGAQGMAIAYKLAKQKYGRDIVVIDQVAISSFLFVP